jgi:hypothetical protein
MASGLRIDAPFFVPQRGEKQRQCGALASIFNEVEVQENKHIEHKPLAIEYKPKTPRDRKVAATPASFSDARSENRARQRKRQADIRKAWL